MADWLIVVGAVGALLASMSLLGVACMLFYHGRPGLAWFALFGFAVLVFSTILGDMYATGWWDR